MSQLEDATSEWIQIFLNANSPDPEVQGPANDAIVSKLNNDSEIPEFIDICNQILLIDEDDENLDKAKSLSSILLCQMLKIDNENELNQKRQLLTQDGSYKELTDRLKEALTMNISSENPTIRNKCAQGYSLLFAILAESWKDGIDNIVDFCTIKNVFKSENADYSPNTFIGFISIMREIVNLPSFESEIFEPCEEQFTQILAFCIDILSQEDNENNFQYLKPEMRIEACRYVNDIMLMCPQVFHDQDEFAARIPTLLNNLPNSFMVKDITLFNYLHQLLFMVVKQFYRAADKFMETIAEYVGNGFNYFNTNNDCVNIAIYFWKEVASLEESIIDKYNINQKLKKSQNEMPLSPLLTEAVSDNLMPVLLDFMENINEDDISVEDVQKNPEPSMYATVTIQSFYKLIPENIFNIVRERFEKEISHEESWKYLHAAILMIYSIIEEPFSDVVLEFIKEYFELLLEAANHSQVPRLRETALFVIGLIIKNYPKIISDCEDCDKRVSDIVNIFEQTLQMDEDHQSNVSPDELLIFSRYASIIYHLSSVWKNNSYESRLENYFDKFYELLGLLFNLGICNGDHNLIQNSSEALNQLIFNSTPPLVVNKLGDLYKQTIELLIQSKQFYYSPEIIFMVQSSFCSNISTILLKLRKNRKCEEIIKDLAPNTLSILYNLLSNKNTYIYEEGLMAISALINATNSQNTHLELLTPETFRILVTDFIYNGLISLNSGVINASCLLIGNLYYFLSSEIPDLFDAIPDIFDELSNIILEHKEMRESHPFILKAIADIFNYIDLSKGPKPDLEEQLRTLLLNIYNVSDELDITSKTDVEYGNLFYQYLSDAFAGYARIYYEEEDVQIEREQLFMLDKLSASIYKLSPKINEGLYVSFMGAAREFANRCSRRNNVILNRHSVHRILKLGYENAKNQEMKKRMKDAIDYLKSK